MADTVRGMISNFLDNVKQLGYVPNGGRIYYERSQPPLLLPMVDGYYESSKDVDFIRDNLWIMEQEFRFWMQNRTVAVGKDGIFYAMARYAMNREDPRPEAFA
jgi:alpha,alpha-trehalase